MSHMGRLSIGTRAIFAVAAVCALVFGLLVSGAAQSARGETAMRASFAGAAHLAMCHDHSFGASKGEAPHQENDGTARSGCACCLAAHAGAAILPEREAAFIRLERASAPVLYLAASERPPRSAALDAANGARAPPRYASISRE